MKKLLAVSLALLLLCGCASSVADLRFPTAATTGALYPIGGALAELWNKNVKNVRVSAQASAGGLENLNLLRSGDAELGFAVTSILCQSYTGTGSFDGQQNDKLRVLTGLYYNPNQIVVTEDCGAESLRDLDGLRFAPGAPGSTTTQECELHLTAAGLKYPDCLKAQFVGFTEATDLMRNRQLDGAWIMAGLGNAAVTEMLSTCGGRLLPVDDATIAALQAEYPWYARFTIPAGTYEGQDADVQTTAIKLVLFCSADLADDTAYALVKTFWENIDTLSESYAALKGLTVADAVTDLAGVPLHDGAAKYYREAGVLD